MLHSDDCNIVAVKISATIITFNEERNIAGAVRSLKWADEIVVVDSHSSDATREIARDLGARVIERDWPGFSNQKQFAVDEASNDWIFSLDADEHVPPKLADEILCLHNGDADGYLVPRLTFYMGRAIKHSGWYPDRQLRLFDRTKGQWNGRLIHESVEMFGGSVVRDLKHDLHHFTVRTAAEHNRMIGDRYAPLAAKQMMSEGRRTSAFKVVTAAPAAFARSFFVKAGFLDGFPGYCIAKFAAHHAFLKHMLLWDEQRRQSGAAGDLTTPCSCCESKD